MHKQNQMRAKINIPKPSQNGAIEQSKAKPCIR